MTVAAAYWGPGEGPTGDDAVAAFASMRDLAERLTKARTWHRSGERPTRPVTREDLPEVLAEGVNLDDGSPRQVMTDLGRRLRLWDGTDGGARISAAVEGTARTWRGSALMEHPDLPTSADEAWPILAEMIRIWGPQTASWTNKTVRRFGLRSGLSAAQPHFGVLTWVRDGVDAPFVGGDRVQVEGGRWYRFGDDLGEITAETAERVIRPLG